LVVGFALMLTFSGTVLRCQMATLPDQPRRAEASAAKRDWIDWIVFASIILVGGTILGAKRQRGRRSFKLAHLAQGSNPPKASHGTNVATDPHTAPLKNLPEEESVTGHPNGATLTLQSPGLGNSERNERLMEAYLEAATKGIFPADPGEDFRGLPRGPKPPGERSPLSSILQQGEGSYFTRVGGVQPQPLLNTITALAFAVDAKGPYTTGHSQAVSRLAARIAIQAGLSAPEVEETRLAGLVHDIGKIHVPESLCNKPDRLTAEEFELMRKHPDWGAKILEPLNLKTIERIVRHHHERFDGKGYPDGLAADKIPLGARIVAVAESFHSMVSELPYQKARPFEDALAELRRCSGMQFDPKVVMTFLDWIQVYTILPK